MNEPLPTTGYTPFTGPRLSTRRGPGGRAVVGSIVLHAVLIGGALASGQLAARVRPEPVFKAYRVKIYSPPPQVEGEPADIVPAPAIVKRPPPAPKPEAKKEPAKKPDAKTATTKPADPPKAKPVTGRNAQAGPVGGEGLNVLQEGEDFPDPVYLENIIRQLHRHFRWSGEGGLITEIGFVIQRDGSVTNIRVLKRSGNRLFDVAAVEAVEQAGKRNVFGRLPSVWTPPTLPVAFTFEPAR